MKSEFKDNSAQEKGAVFVYTKPFQLNDIVYVDNHCKNLINKDTYEPDLLAVIIPKSLQNYKILEK